MKTKMKTVIGMMAGVLALSGVAHAQSAGVGGGGFTEGEMKGFMGLLSDYFTHKDYSGLFPEVVAWEKNSGIKMGQFILMIEPKVVNHTVYFPAGVERDCVSYLETQGAATRRWFECNAARVPESKLENQPKLYALLAHEIFVQAGIEKAGDANVPSTYEVSSKFLNKKNLSLETIQRYVPGNSAIPADQPAAIPPLLKYIRRQLTTAAAPTVQSASFRKCRIIDQDSGVLKEHQDHAGYIHHQRVYSWRLHAGYEYKEVTATVELVNRDLILLLIQFQGVYGRRILVNADLEFSPERNYRRVGHSSTVVTSNGELLVELVTPFNPKEPARGAPSATQPGMVAYGYYYCTKD